MITYEKALAEDVELIYRLCRRLMEQYEDSSVLADGRVLQWVHRKIEKMLDDYRVIHVDGRKTGYYHFYKNEDGKYEIDDLYIFPAYQGHGIGTAVVKKCCAEADGAVMLYVFVKNKRAISLYSRLGLEIVQTIQGSRYIMERLGDGGKR